MVKQTMIDYMAARAEVRRSPYGRGYGSAFGGSDINPHPTGTQEHEQWADGYSAGITEGRAMGRTPSES